MYEVIQFFYAAEQNEDIRNSRSYSEVDRLTSSFYERLSHWYHNLPECIKEEQTWTPAVIGLQYASIVL